MNKIKLTIRERGRFVEIPGLAAFRTPATIDVTKIKLSILIQSLHSCGVNNYELVSEDRKGNKTYTQDDFNLPEKKKEDTKIGNRLDRMEDLLLKLISNGSGQKVASSEQITNRLNSIERMLRKGQKIIYKGSSDGSPVVEELDDQYIPEIDISEMQISGKTTEVVEKTLKEDIDDAVDLLSSLTKNGGK